MLEGCWGAGKGGVGEVEGGRPDDDDGGRTVAENCRRMIGGVLPPKTSTRNGGVSERKGGRGQELTAGNSTPQHLSTVSWDNENDGDVVPHVSVVRSNVGAVPTSPTVEFREVGAAACWDRQSSMTTLPLALPLRRGGLPVVSFVFGAMRPRFRGQIQCMTPSLKNSGQPRSSCWGRWTGRFHWESSSSSPSPQCPSSLWWRWSGAVEKRHWLVVGGGKR